MCVVGARPHRDLTAVVQGHAMSNEFDHAPTVLCPRGHVNSWAYKFCGQCGTPIGVVAFPDDEDTVEDSVSPRRRRLLIGGAISAAVVVVATAATIGVLMTRPAEEPADPQHGGFATGTVNPASAVPRCATPPAMQAESVEMTPDGLAVDAAFMSQCAGGNTEAGTSVRITVADGQRDIAAGLFDFSAAPLAMKPGETARRTLVFPAGMYWRTTAMFSGAPKLVFHPGDQQESTSTTSGANRLVAQAVAEPEHGSVDGVAEAVLRELRDSDYEFVSGVVANRWVPQISSKKVGMVIEGKPFTSADILRDHLRLRAKYSAVRLISSNQWTTFDTSDWWVTIIGVPELEPREANRWCESQKLGPDDCFAKFVSALFGVEGTTVHRK